VVPEGLDLLSLLLSGTAGTSVGPVLKALLFGTHSFEAHLFDVLAVLADGFRVLVDLVSHKLNDKSVRILFVAVKIIGELLGVSVDPRHNFLMKYVFLELVREEASILKEGENGAAEIAHI
jgi:hypothetical protein